MRPALRVLSDGQLRHIREIRETLAAEFNLSDADQAALIPSGTQRVFDSRVG